jgi:hypothetical protein
MKSTVFELKFPDPTPNWMATKEKDVIFPIPTLKAYAIEYSEFTLKGGFNEHKEMIERRDYDLLEDGLIWHTSFAPMHPSMNYYRLVIHYYGIKDYSLLFPHVSNPTLQQRLGEFYEEAEASLDSGTWLAFALMCGAVYEGLLYHHFGEKNEKFDVLIKNGQEAKILDTATVNTLRTAQELRNLVHANKADKQFVTRVQALEMRTVLDRMIKDAAYWVRE